MTEKEYMNLKNAATYAGLSHGFTIMDCEDILHDTCVHIIEHGNESTEWKRLLYKYIGKYREKRNRESKRNTTEVTLESNID
tara:strand:+ start:207 stop:452 length:246 start_codon:yes stop_codon:yes gene_type:complete